jgi:hypothetical protein
MDKDRLVAIAVQALIPKQLQQRLLSGGARQTRNDKK